MKEKLFVSNRGLGFVPALISLVIDQRNQTVYVSNILSSIDKQYNIDSLLNDQDAFASAYTELAKQFTNLQEQDLEFVVKLVALKRQPNEQLKEHVNSYIGTVFEQQTELLQQYNKLNTDLTDYYKIVRDKTDFAEYLGDPIQFTVFNVVVNIRGNAYEPGVKGRYIKLMQIFNTMELSEDIPLIAIADPTTGDPMIKAHNKIATQTSKKEIKSWFLNEKKKTNSLTYKKIRGLLFKFRIKTNDFITINLVEDGQSTIKLNHYNQLIDSFSPILDVLKRSFDHVMSAVNSLNGIFMQPKRVDLFDQSTIQIESFSATISTSTLLNRSHIEDVLSNVAISENIFELKDTMSEDVLSILYKRSKQTTSITVNIKDDPYKLNSSILTVFGIDNVEQLIVIAKQIVVLDLLNNNKTGDIHQKLREKSHIKDLRKQGVETSSKKCQKDRQPSVVQGVARSSTYTLEFDNRKYVCPSKEYPYPGFTNDNIVCCFKKDQRSKPVYIRNTNAGDYDIIVQPSNYKIKITDANRMTFTTYAIRVISEYHDGFDANNSMPRFYYISNNHVMEAITNSNLIQELENLEAVYWLDDIPLASIISESPKNKCNFPPNMENKSDTDLNAPCSHHAKNKTFAYNTNSYPCCFTKEPDSRLLAKRQKDKDDLLSKHIFTSDKILEHQRIGLLPQILDNVFNNLVKHDPQHKFYRMGVHQNTSSFLSAILLALNDNSNHKEFRKSISNFLQQTPSLYAQLNAGNLSLKYGKLDNFIKYVLDLNEIMYWEDLLDLVQRFTGTNIILIDIPYLGRDPNYDETTFVCNPYQKIDKSLPCIILIKRQSRFELVFRMDEVQSTPLYQFKYDANDTIHNNIVNFFVDYQEASCIKQSRFPENYVYSDLFEIDEITTILQDTPHLIISQVMNKFRKVNYVMTKRGVLIPIKEGGARDSLKIVTLSQLRSKDKLWDYHTYQKGIEEVNSLIPTKIKLLGVTVDKFDGQSMYTSTLTSFGQFVPIKHTRVTDTDDIPILDVKFYEDVDDSLAKQIIGNDMQTEYNRNQQANKHKIFQIKTKLADELSRNEILKDQILSINKSITMTRHQKLQELINMFEKIIGTQSEFLQLIANEILNDNVENLLLNNIVISDVFDPNTISKRDSESVLMNIADMEKWFAKYERK
jgi:hypothetical protein